MPPPPLRSGALFFVDGCGCDDDRLKAPQGTLPDPLSATVLDGPLGFSILPFEELVRSDMGTLGHPSTREKIAHDIKGLCRQVQNDTYDGRSEVMAAG